MGFPTVGRLLTLDTILTDPLSALKVQYPDLQDLANFPLLTHEVGYEVGSIGIHTKRHLSGFDFCDFFGFFGFFDFFYMFWIASFIRRNKNLFPGSHLTKAHEVVSQQNMLLLHLVDIEKWPC